MWLRRASDPSTTTYVCARQPLRLLERPPLRNPQLTKGSEAEGDEHGRRGGHLVGVDHDVAVDHRFRRKARHRRAADMLDRSNRHTSHGHRVGVLETQRLEPLGPGRVVVDDGDHDDAL
jgi:hypothetical protein